MANVAKYYVLLEEIKIISDADMKSDADKFDTDYFQFNLKILHRYIKDTPQSVYLQLLNNFIPNQPERAESNLELHDDRTTCILYMQHMLLHIINNTNFDSDAKEDLISTRHMNLCIAAIKDLDILALRQQIHPLFCKSGVYATPASTECVPCNYALLQLNVHFFTHVLHNKHFHVANNMEDVLRDYMTAIYTLRLASLREECILTDDEWRALQMKLNAIWNDISKVQYMRNILMLKGIAQLPVEMQKQLHVSLLQKLQSPNGFTTLVATLYAAQQSAVQNEQKMGQIVAQIVAHRAHSCAFQNAMLDQIFPFLKSCLRTEAMLNTMSAGLLCLRRLYDLSSDNQTRVLEHLNELVLILVQPSELLSGLILMEHVEFCELIALWYELFCTSVVECLPSAVLVPYLPLLLQLYYDLPPAFTVQRHQLTSLVTRCLDNRPPADLEELLERLYANKFKADWQRLHARVLLRPNATHTEIRIQVAPSEFKAEFSLSLALPELLMASEHNVLIYRIFMLLLRLWHKHADESTDSTTDNIDLLHTEEELLAFLHAKYPIKVDILLSLNALISHPPLKAQISEHATDFLQFLRDVICRRVAQPKCDESCDQILLILLALTQELLMHAKLPAERFGSDFLPSLQQLQRHNYNELLQQQIIALQSILSGNECNAKANNNNSLAFQKAREHIESSQPHLQVYGMQQMLALLRDRDATALANGHVIIALALNALKSPESYTFLNCVRLFVSLVYVMEAQVLELLADEYLSDNASVDYRLVVGEALLKVSKELGPLVYKYKSVLLNTFMTGARSHSDEFRMSAFANLAQLCRTLYYQVQTFFQELLHLIDCELTTGRYVGAKRAAVLVLSELLEGMDNLMDFGEMLFPVYRLLKLLEANPPDADERIRTHAINGLKVLNSKCKALLFPTQSLHKEIKVLGINETKSKHSLKAHILDLS